MYVHVSKCRGADVQVLIGTREGYWITWSWRFHLWVTWHGSWGPNPTPHDWAANAFNHGAIIPVPIVKIFKPLRGFAQFEIQFLIAYIEHKDFNKLSQMCFPREGWQICNRTTQCSLINLFLLLLGSVIMSFKQRPENCTKPNDSWVIWGKEVTPLLGSSHATSIYIYTNRGEERKGFVHFFLY